MPFIAIDFVTTFASLVNAFLTLMLGDAYGFAFLALTGLQIYFFICLMSLHKENKEKFQFDLNEWRRSVWNESKEKKSRKDDRIVQNFC